MRLGPACFCYQLTLSNISLDSQQLKLLTHLTSECMRRVVIKLKGIKKKTKACQRCGGGSSKSQWSTSQRWSLKKCIITSTDDRDFSLITVQRYIEKQSTQGLALHPKRTRSCTMSQTAEGNLKIYVSDKGLNGLLSLSLTHTCILMGIDEAPE